MNLRVLAFLLSLVTLISGALSAEEMPKRNIKKGYQITVSSYDKKTDTFLLAIVGESAVGPNYARSEDLRKAIAYEGSKQDFNNQRPQMTGSVYTLNKDLPLLELSDLAVMTKRSLKKK